MRNFLLPALCTVVLSCAVCRGREGAELARQRALLLTQAIEEDFWDANKGAYLESSPLRTKGLRTP
jgi:hypothetical protein